MRKVRQTRIASEWAWPYGRDSQLCSIVSWAKFVLWALKYIGTNFQRGLKNRSSNSGIYIKNAIFAVATSRKQFFENISRNKHFGVYVAS